MAEALRAVDANVLLRYLLNDVPAQAARARRLIESEATLGMTAVVLAEVAWTLAGPRYKWERTLVAACLLDLLTRENIEAVGFVKAEAQASLLACTPPQGAASFGDALIAACARSAGIDEIYSFDQQFARAGITPVPPP